MLLIKALNQHSRNLKLEFFRNKSVQRFIHEFNFDGEEEILTNKFGEYMTIGINLPDSKNKLTETAVMKLKESILKFDEDSDVKSGVIHGIGGNFCSGLVSSKKALELGNDLLNTLNTLKKPLIAAMDGYTTNFGFSLATMCDIRFMDQGSLVGFSRSTAQELMLPPFVYKRLILTMGLSKTTELICTQTLQYASDCLNVGFISRMSDVGTALGVSCICAQSIAFHNSLENVVALKANVLSFLETDTDLIKSLLRRQRRKKQPTFSLAM